MISLQTGSGPITLTGDTLDSPTNGGSLLRELTHVRL
jgi:hypothetical protein